MGPINQINVSNFRHTFSPWTHQHVISPNYALVPRFWIGFERILSNDYLIFLCFLLFFAKYAQLCLASEDNRGIICVVLIEWVWSRRFFYVTVLRDPLTRFLSEWRHVQRGATWKRSNHMCNSQPHEIRSCYEGKCCCCLLAYAIHGSSEGGYVYWTFFLSRLTFSIDVRILSKR